MAKEVIGLRGGNPLPLVLMDGDRVKLPSKYVFILRVIML